MTKQSTQTNGIDTDKAKGFVGRVEALNAEILSERGVYMANAKGIRASIKEVIVEATSEGIPAKALKATIKDRELQRRRGVIAAGLDIDEGVAFEQMKEALGEFGSSPLGAAALAAVVAPIATVVGIATA